MTKVSAKLRRDVTKRAKGFCEYCRSNSAFSDSPFDVEHIISILFDGKTILENLALSCHGCNLHKSSKIEGFDVVSEETVKLFHPRNDDWNENFTWAEEFSIIVGLTSIGRATVEVLKLNRKGLVNQRKMLYLFDKHPPK
ncbi:MAG: HNH endonuclease [Pyrinomonadaceae bacterium]